MAISFTAATTHTKTLTNPSTGSEDKVYGVDYVSASSHTTSVAVAGATAARIPYASSATELTDSANLTYSETSGPRLTVGSGSTTNVGVIVGYSGTTTYSGLWPQGSTPGPVNGVSFNTAGKATVGTSSAAGTQARLDLWNDGQIDLTAGSSLKFSQLATAGRGPDFTMGTATTDVGFRATQTWNAAGVAFTFADWTITDTASAAGSLAFRIRGGAAGTTNLLSLTKQALLTVGVSGGAGTILTNILNVRYFNDLSNSFTIFEANAGTGDCNFYQSASFREMTAPTGTANQARIFAQDNGAGKTQLMVIFGSGVAQQIAIEA